MAWLANKRHIYLGPRGELIEIQLVWLMWLRLLILRDLMLLLTIKGTRISVWTLFNTNIELSAFKLGIDTVIHYALRTDLNFIKVFPCYLVLEKEPFSSERLTVYLPTLLATLWFCSVP